MTPLSNHSALCLASSSLVQKTTSSNVYLPCIFQALILSTPLLYLSFCYWCEELTHGVSKSQTRLNNSADPMDYSMPGFPVLHEACSNSCPLSWWCHPTISSSVIPFSSCLSVFPSIRVFSNESVLRIRWPKYAFGISQLKTQKSSVYTLIFHQSPWFADLSQVRILYREIVISKRKGNFAG